MPSRFPFASLPPGDAFQEMGDGLSPKRPRRSSLMRNLRGFWRSNHEQREVESESQLATAEQPLSEEYCRTRRSSVPEAGAHRRAIPSLPRPQTFRRQESEKREKLLVVPPSPTERRTLSLDRRRGHSASPSKRHLSPTPFPDLSLSAPDITNTDQESKLQVCDRLAVSNGSSKSSREPPVLPPLHIPSLDELEFRNVDDVDDDEIDPGCLQAEHEQRWILNLSMHFRDKSNREKFFVTFAATPIKWRRLTVSLDYRNAPDGSLEADLSTLHYQRDKSFHIYEAIRESLSEIQFYDTVTNLKLETTREDGQLHVHVREDANEIINFPSIDLFAHVSADRYRESEVEFITHLSGFVYKVHAAGKVVIKKEIPGPDTVDEFLYEVNALDAVLDSKRVVGLEGLVTDECGTVVKGLLISFALQGALVDILYDHRDLPWHRREKWAKQIVEGLSDVHEAGFVQGDFTLSNVVIDENDDAIIIDINRRGCPVGWEPPELSKLIDSGQRVGMCIGVKTDVYQLGMVLWALAMVVDEPERQEQPLPCMPDSIPAYYHEIVDWCLSERPQGRPTAERVFQHFPSDAGRSPSLGSRSVDFADEVKLSDHSISTSHRSDKEYIDPNLAITIEDVNERNRWRDEEREVSPFTSEQVTYFDPRDPSSNQASTSYHFDSSGSWVVGRRGRSPVSSRRRRSSPFARPPSSSPATSLSRSPPSRSRRRCGSESSEDQQHYDNDVVQNWNGLWSPALSQCDGGVDESGGVLLTPLCDLEFGNGRDAGELLHADSGFDESMVEQIDPAAQDLETFNDVDLVNQKLMHDGRSSATTKATSSADVCPSHTTIPLPVHAGVEDDDSALQQVRSSNRLTNDGSTSGVRNHTDDCQSRGEEQHQRDTTDTVA